MSVTFNSFHEICNGASFKIFMVNLPDMFTKNLTRVLVHLSKISVRSIKIDTKEETLGERISTKVIKFLYFP